jgi:FkbM family methyltransferase
MQTVEERLAKYLRDAEDYWFYADKPHAGDVIVDIGAGRGEDVYAFSRGVGPAGHVWAIEAHPESFDHLTAFCEEQHLNNVTCLNLAVLDRPGLFQVETLPVWESNYVREGEATATSHPMEGITFDALCRRHSIGRIDFLKMNIEGAERHALPGMKEAIRRTGCVCIAAHDFRADRGEGEEFRTRAFVERFLLDAGFTLTARDSDPRYYVPYHIHGVRR